MVLPNVFVNSSSDCETCKPSRKVRLKLAIMPAFSESLLLDSAKSWPPDKATTRTT